jgi:glycosyltransferase involved in cell wall biosynthesis
MKLAFISQPWATALPPSESIAIGTKAIAERLAGEHESTIWGRAAGAGEAVARAEGVTYRFVSGRGDYRINRLVRPRFTSYLHYPSYHLAVVLGVRKQRPDAIRVSNFSKLVPLFRRACPSARVVLSMHCEWLTQLDRRLTEKQVDGADVVVGVSDFVTDRIREAFPRVADRCVTVYNGADVARFRPEDRPPARGTVRLLTVGRISPEKGTHVLLEAFARVAPRRPEVELYVVGKEGLPPREMLLDIDRTPRVRTLEPLYRDGYLQRLLAALPAEARDRVHFLPWAEHDQLPDRYAEADLFVFPSIWDEPFGIPVAEAMAAGLPVVATRAGGIPEIVDDGTTGLLVEPSDPEQLAAAIESLVDDAGLRAELGAAGRRRAVECFTWDRAGEAYRSIFAGRGAGRA